MWVRSGFWEGKALPGREDALRALIADRILPGIRAFSTVSRASLLWPRAFEDRPANLFCQIMIEYADEAAMHEMRAHPDFVALKATVADAIALLDGGVSHINYQAG